MRKHPNYVEIKDLIHEYQRTNDVDTLHNIFRKLDNMILGIAIKQQARVSDYKYVPLADLYQTAYVGTKRAIDTMKAEESSMYIGKRVAGYVASAIRNKYKKNTIRNQDTSSLENIAEIVVTQYSVFKEVEMKFEMEHIAFILGRFLHRKLITLFDVKLFKRRFLDEKTCAEIGIEEKLSRQYVTRRIHNVCAMLKNYEKKSDFYENSL